MIKFNKYYNLKLVSVIILAIFTLHSTIYAMDLPKEFLVRVPSSFQYDLQRILEALIKVSEASDNTNRLTFEEAKNDLISLIRYKKYDLQIDIPDTFACGTLDIKEISRKLSKRNWFWRQSRQEVRKKAIKRIEILLDKLSFIQELDSFREFIGDRKIIAIYTAGSYPWHDKPGDVDIHFIVEGEREFEMRKLSNEDNEKVNLILYPTGKKITEIVLQVFGTTNLEKAAQDENLKDEGDLQRKLLTIYGNSVQLAGLDLFKENHPPIENLLILIYYLRSLADRNRDIKRDKLLFEVAAIEDYLQSIKDISFEGMASDAYLKPTSVSLAELIQILESHLDEIIERKHSHMRNVISFMEYFIVHDFDALCKTFSSEMFINETEYKERLQELFLIYQALSPEAKEILKVATVFHDIGSIKGERDWIHNQIGADKIKAILRGLDYREAFIEKVSRIILHHGFYSNMGVDYLPKDFSGLTDEEKDTLLLIGVFDCSGRAKGNILVPWKVKELINLRNTRIEDFIKNKDFYKYSAIFQRV